jgi:diacylglycerol kinase (ATP)
MRGQRSSTVPACVVLEFCPSVSSSATLIRDMRAAAIFGLGCSPKDLAPFKTDNAVEWLVAMPSSSDQADATLLFGGDGTIHRHLGEMVRLGLPVLVVPAGSGNDFARALDLCRVRDSIAAWRLFCQSAKNVRTVDLGTITPLEDAGGAPAPREPACHPALGVRYFCCAAGVGLDGEISRRANHLPRWLRGHGGYVLGLVSTLFRFTPFPIKIQTAQLPIDAATNSNATGADKARRSTWLTRSDQPTILAAFANTQTYGGGMKIAPHAVLDDSLLDACVIGGMDPFKLFCLFPTVYFGRHLNIREVEYFQANRLRVETDTPLDVYADGEYVCRTPVEVSVATKALRVIVNPRPKIRVIA